MTKKASPVSQEMPSNALKGRLDGSHINSSRTFWPLFNVKGHARTFTEGFKTGRIDCAMMHKHIRSVFLLDEPKTFMVIKPLNSSVYHNIILLSKNFNVTN